MNRFVTAKKSPSFNDYFKKKSNKKTKVTLSGIDDEIAAMTKTAVLNTPKPQALPTTGSAIKSGIQSVLSKKYGEIDTKHLFDGISDKDIEDNIETAENAIQTNIDRGMLNKNALPKLPNLRDGLALSYAAANKGNSKAATRAREAAYMEGAELLVKDTLSNELPKFDNVVPKTNKKPKVVEAVDNPNDKAIIEDWVVKTSLSDENKKQVFDNPLLDTDISWQSKALGDSKKADEKHMVEDDFPKLEKKKETKNEHQFNGVTGDYQHEVLSNYYKDGKLDSNEYKHVSDYLNHKTNPPVAYYGRIDKNNDLGNSEYSKNDMMKFDRITENELALSKDEHIKRWKNLAKLTSWSKPKMGNVLFEMIDHFADGSGTNYTNEILTQEVKNHPETQRYMKDFSDVFGEQLQAYNGDVSALLASNSLKNELNNKKIYLSTYDYSGIGDLFGGLEHAIHSWTESEVEISSLKINPDGTYRGELKFVFADNFGLDNDDIKEFGDYAGFRSWFILQHYDKFSDCAPFKTVVKINYPISGKIEGYNNDETIN